ncbi:type II toxin-antitoxin system RatA family toxin [Paracoccus sp. S-4012]|uniref:type II toxin-antitoxin system RatA family toxin n=1 Tax=Paracoccus sp. S-4012 TaxID=2665648 RepID=UPI00132ADC1C|nr:type II toxin-antitoxin system RatA family toxin [Paracoccus sp. S-4012]
MPKFADTRRVPWTAEEMYALVADVERYPDFLPWNSAARIRSRREGERPGTEVIEADMVISFKLFREKFGSRVTLDPEGLDIDTRYLDGPFKFLHSGWTFRDLPEGGSEVDFHVDFEFRNAILQKVIGVVFGEAMSRIVRAFEDRARKLYGPGAG